MPERSNRQLSRYCHARYPYAVCQPCFQKMSI
jgi:hypothetical protein